MRRIYFLSIILYLISGLIVIFTVVSGYSLKNIYAAVLSLFTFLVTIAAIWQIRSWQKNPNKLHFEHTWLSKLLVLHQIGAVLTGSTMLLLLNSLFLSQCNIYYTAPSHHKTIVIKDFCLYDCDSYLYLQSFVFEKQLVQLIDDGGGFCLETKYNNTHLQWSSDERQIIWVIGKQQGIVNLPN